LVPHINGFSIFELKKLKLWDRLHGTAKTTHRIRKEIQASKESIKKLAERYNINVKTVRKWKSRDFVEDLKCGRKKGEGSVLKGITEQIVVEVCRKTLLPLDDLPMVLKPIIPELTRSNLIGVCSEIMSV
jgi:hypothetical protein